MIGRSFFEETLGIFLSFHKFSITFVFFAKIFSFIDEKQSLGLFSVIIIDGDDMRQQTYYEAYLDDYDKVIVYLSRNSYDGVSNRFYLTNKWGQILELHIQSIEPTPSNFNKFTLSLYEDIEIGTEYYVVHQHARRAVLQYCGIVKTQRFDEQFFYDGDDLGVSLDNNQTTFALWAPTASEVKVEICKNEVKHTIDLLRGEKGVWRLSILENLENATYVYLVKVNGKWEETIDPYGASSIENSLRSAIIDTKKIKLQDFPLTPMKSACDAILYEASVRDFTIQSGIGVTRAGQFKGFVEENEKTKELHTGFSYLKELGVTHVQLMPVLDFGSVDELYPLMHYNWGYDPVQYRTLEGSFSVDPNNPYSRVFGFLQLVEECHKHDIRVNLDVVFNHVYDKENSAFEKTVPNYYFQMNSNGDFSNGTYCGNDIDSKRLMCSKYIVDTCAWLTKTYHIDGLRFDLMGILDIDTLNEVYRVCSGINPDFMVYGEGWDMPSFLDYRERASIRNQAAMPYIGHFSDRFRDVIKGRTDANEVNVKGYCTGAIYLIDIMKNCLCGSCNDIGVEKMFVNPRNAVNYVECHDNMTSWDKVRECCKEDDREVRIKRQEMMIAAVLLGQGIPFLHSGQEFARTKHGKHNTYEESDEINKIDYIRRNRYQKIVDCTKALITIRKSYRCFRYSTAQEVASHVSFDSIDQKVLLYKLKDEEEDMIVIFNPTGEYFTYTFDAAYQLLYQDGKSEDILIQTVNIQPYSTMVFKRG